MPEKFSSNCELAIHVPDLVKAEEFYGNVLGFKLLSKSAEMLEFDTGKLRFYIKQDDKKSLSFIPSLNVADSQKAKDYLESNSCEVFNESEEGFYFKDPFGFNIDVVERQ